MEDLFEALKQGHNEVAENKFYKVFSTLNANKDKETYLESIINEMWDLIEKGVLKKDLVYLYLILETNNKLLDKFLERDKFFLLQMVANSPYKSLDCAKLCFDYGLINKNHFLYLLIKSEAKETLPKDIYDKFICLLIITNTNECGKYFECTDKNVDEFWLHYVEQIRNIQKLLEFCLKACEKWKSSLEFLYFASQNVIFETNHKQIEIFIDELSLSHKVLLSDHLETISCYLILDFFLKQSSQNKDSDATACHNIQCNHFFNLQNCNMQIQLLQLIYRIIFIELNTNCNEKGLQMILSTLKIMSEQLWAKVVSCASKECLENILDLQKVVIETAWQLDLVINVAHTINLKENLQSYMSADDLESLLTICLAKENFKRALQVFKIFNLKLELEEELFGKILKDLNDSLKVTANIIKNNSETSLLNIDLLHFDDVCCVAIDELSPLSDLNEYKLDKKHFINILDFVSRDAQPYEDSKILATTYASFSDRHTHQSPFSIFYQKLQLIFSKGYQNHVVTIEDLEQQHSVFDLLEVLYTQLLQSLSASIMEGILTKEHKSHELLLNMSKVINEHCGKDSVNYLEWLYKYVQAFSNQQNNVYLNLLNYNRSKLLSKLLFQNTTTFIDFKRYFTKLKVDFLLNVVGTHFILNANNCISEIPKVFQNDMSYSKVKEYVESEIVKCQGSSSSQIDESLEAAEEVSEDKLKSVNWVHLLQIVDNVPEAQFKKEELDFIALRDKILENLVRDGFECEYYKYVRRINDREIRIGLLLENVKNWPEAFCIKCLKWELGLVEDEKVGELRLWLKHIEQCKNIMSVLGVKNWSEMYVICTFHPKLVLDKFLAQKEIILLLDYIEFHEVSEATLLSLNESFFKGAFDLEIDINLIKQLLKLLPIEYALKLCKNLLTELNNLNHLQFITEFLMGHCDDSTLNHIKLSLMMLSSIRKFDQELLILMREPLSIIEMFIMNMNLESLDMFLKAIEGNIPVTENDDDVGMVTVEKIDELLRKYAEKSLEFRVRVHTHATVLDEQNFSAFIMPDEVPTKDQWVANNDVIKCMCCKSVIFSMFNRRHHCRRCGRVICYECSKERMCVPSYGNILVRVCSNCYSQTVKLSSDIPMQKAVVKDYWVLTTDPVHDRLVREEFSYEFAPSVSFCLSLMQYHSRSEEKSKFLVEQCETILKLLIPDTEPIQEIDYMLVIDMLKSLALAAKMAAEDTSLHFGSSSADRIISQAELLSLLAERGCLSMLRANSNVAFVDSIALMKLIDKLLEQEKWLIALEVSTKAGLNYSSVFAAWGLSCLKAGCLEMAREKFSKCLDKNISHDPCFYDIESSSCVKSTSNPPLLNEIVKILECKKRQLNDVQFEDMQTFVQNISKVHKSKPTTKCKLSDLLYNECIYYLSKYGTIISQMEFHMRQEHMDKALKCALTKKLAPEHFLEFYMRNFKKGEVKKLQAAMSEIDPALCVWKDYLMHICAQLERQNSLLCLYQLQQYMGDYVRAAMTCIRFYTDKAFCYTDLLNNVSHLTRALEHFEQARQKERWIAISTVNTTAVLTETSVASSLIKKMSANDIECQMVTIKMQIEIDQFLADYETIGSILPMEVFAEMLANSDDDTKKRNRQCHIPTLFGSDDQRKFVTTLCIVCTTYIDEGFKLVMRILNTIRIKPIQIFKEIGKYFIRNEKFEEITTLVQCFHTYSNSAQYIEICDEMLLIIVGLLKNSSTTNLEDLIKLISNKSVKISAYIELKQLKPAYLLATKYRIATDLKRILREAELANQGPLRVLCQKALQQCSQSSHSCVT